MCLTSCLLAYSLLHHLPHRLIRIWREWKSEQFHLQTKSQLQNYNLKLHVSASFSLIKNVSFPETPTLTSLCKNNHISRLLCLNEIKCVSESSVLRKNSSSRGLIVHLSVYMHEHKNKYLCEKLVFKAVNIYDENTAGLILRVWFAHMSSERQRCYYCCFSRIMKVSIMSGSQRRHVLIACVLCCMKIRCALVFHILNLTFQSLCTILTTQEKLQLDKTV